ncbi:hypothetical protein J2T15_002122 [Paenibacillus harenae]|uniref:Spore coat protein D n=1 Tax=Paenibacillus harenae TaxID=306543 RepID=A0ABT9TZ83_PAEHA|nr:hypothetical protein [Paenibacillus harenae]MDQ0112687.1 hypothetical protein [Paenibacillus harenae]
MCCKPFCPTVRVYDPPVTVVNDVYHPQIVEVVHQVNVVTRHHCVPCEKHIYEYNYQDEGLSPSGADGSNGTSTISKAKSRKKRSKR